MGQSGSGKSTILRLILGILEPDSGEIFFKQFEYYAIEPAQATTGPTAHWHGISIFRAASSRTVRENVALPLEELTRKPAKEINEIVESKLALVGMEDACDRMPSELSGGMRKRVSLARALVLEPGAHSVRRTVSRARSRH